MRPVSERTAVAVSNETAAAGTSVHVVPDPLRFALSTLYAVRLCAVASHNEVAEGSNMSADGSVSGGKTGTVLPAELASTVLAFAGLYVLGRPGPGTMKTPAVSRGGPGVSASEDATNSVPFAMVTARTSAYPTSPGVEPEISTGATTGSEPYGTSQTPPLPPAAPLDPTT